ncbi:MAG: AsmA-like C-terminal region-containing protein [Bacteroidota bacterium]
MKKFLISVFVFILLLIAGLIAAPIIFKDDIKAALDKEIEKSLNAKVFYDDESLNISLFSDFPDISISIENFGIVGVDKFDGDTLLSVGKFGLGLDIMSVISGDQIGINSIDINKPSVMLIVLEDGTANYDIAKPSETTATTEESASSGGLSLQIKNWNITDGDLIYFDQTLPFYTTLHTISHNGSGNFESDVFDMITKTEIAAVSLGYDGVEYLTNKKVVADVTMGMDFPKSTFTFKDNLITVNALPLSAAGFLTLQENENIDMDFSFAGQEMSIKSILSLVPGVYNEYLEGLKASGAVDLSGTVKGTYNENSLPKIHAETHINDGKLVYGDFPIPIEQIQVSSTFDYPSVDLKDASFNVDKFSLMMDGEKTEATLKLYDFEDYHWDAFVSSNLDLEKLTKVIHLEDGMMLKGKISGKVNSKGSLAAIEAENIDQLPTSGELNMAGFYFESADVTEPLSLEEVMASFTPEQISLKSLKGKLGESDFSANGKITDHLAYIFQPDGVLKGSLNFSAGSINLDELMTSSDEEVETTDTDTTALEPVAIPKNIDFVLASTIDQLVYDGLSITDMTGDIIVRDGKVTLNNEFNLLKGQFTIAGDYSTDDIDKPAFNFKLGIADLSIPEAFKNFESVQKFAPIAKKMTGDFSTDFNVSGFLDGQMNPIYSELSGAGLLEIAEASLENMKSLQALTLVSKLGDSDGIVALKDVLMSAELKDGRVSLKPFDIKIGSYNTNVSGSSGIDGSLDYDMRMDVPANAVTSNVTSTIASLTKQSFNTQSDLVLRINMGGTYDQPKPTLAGVETKAGKSIQSEVKDQITAKVDEKKNEVAEEAKAVKDSLVATGKTKLDSAKNEVKQETKNAVTKEVDKAKDKIKSLFKKKKKKKNN